MHHSFIDQYSQINSFIHRLDPRIKIVSFFVIILFITFTPAVFVFTFALYFMLIGTIAVLSKIPIWFILKRSLVIIPFVLVVAAFLPFYKKGQIVGGYSFGSLKLIVTYDGLIIFWNILIKSFLSILCMILLTASTGFDTLLKSFQKLGAPNLIIMIISFMYRYVFVAEDELMKIKLAKESRTVGGSKWFHIKALANITGSVFLNTYEKAESVYLAMCSRGFNGNIRTIDNFRLTVKDWVFLFLILVFLFGIRLLGKYLC